MIDVLGKETPLPAHPLREGTRLIHTFDNDEHVVAMTQFQREPNTPMRLFIATTKGVYELINNALYPLQFREWPL